MKFRDQIPEDLLINPYADKFVTVLDGANDFKQEEIEKALRFYRPPLSMNTSFAIKKLQDLGFPPIPSDFPKDVLDALILNAKDINALRGSKIGLELWLWCLTFGSFVIDDSLFYPFPTAIFPSDPDSGYVSWFSPLITPTVQNPGLFLFSDMADFGVGQIDIQITTKYDAFASITQYIDDHIREYLTFTDQSTIINITYINGPYVTHAFPHQYFVKP